LKLKTKIKPYLIPFIYFSVIFSIGAILNIISKIYLEKPFPELIFKSFTLISFLILILLYKNQKWKIFKLRKISKKQLLIILFLFSLFFISNYISSVFSNQENYVGYIKENFNSFVLIITIASIGEEIIYRGFLQNYVNQFFNDFRVISRGNIFASTLFWITHLGFFTIMEPLFAAMSLFLVAVSSLTLGYLKDKSNGIILPIIVHLICNYIHTFMKISLG
jgi:membrane protease YdiL (CAAX protease family)